MPWAVLADQIRGSTGAVTPTLPSGWAADDIFLILVESNSGETVATPSGYTAIAGTPRAATGTQLWGFWRRAVGGDTAPTIADPGDHLLVQMFAIRGATTSGNPFRVETGGNVASSATVDFLAASATAGDLCFLVNGHPAQVSFTPTSTTNLETPVVTASPISGNAAGGGTSQGNDGSFAVVIGIAAATDTVDAAGTWSSAGVQTQLTLVLIPESNSNVSTSRIGIGVVSGGPDNVVKTARIGIGVVVDTNEDYVPPVITSRRRQMWLS